MTGLLARSLAICALACSSAAVAPRVTAPADPAPPSTAPPDPAPPPAAEPVAEPPVAAVVEPPAPEPALPPCPKDARRDPDQKPDHVIQLVGLADAMTVVDLGSGSGYFLCWLSRAVGAHGHVIATEIDKNLVRDLHKLVEREQLANVEVILAPQNDVGIAAGSADRILVVDVWHHLGDRKRYAARVARALAPGGKIVVVDFKPRGGHGVAPERVLAELSAGGIDGALVPEDLADQYVIVGSVR